MIVSLRHFHRCLFGVLIFAIASSAQPLNPTTFDKFLEKRFAVSNASWNPETFCPVSTSMVARRVLEAYGSMFAAHEQVVLPRTCVQRGEAEVRNYQKSLEIKPLDFGDKKITLQRAAADSLNAALTEATEKGLKLSPLDGSIAGGRTYGDTLMLWNSRFFPALDFWIDRGRLTQADRDEIARLELQKKVEKILEWETQGIYFSTDRSRSILTSTAPPGTSQHLALVAFDLVEYSNPETRAIMNRNGWFQTVIDDPAHFTYLGVAETDLPGRGLRAIYKGTQLYWIPNLISSQSPPAAPPTTN